MNDAQRADVVKWIQNMAAVDKADHTDARWGIGHVSSDDIDSLGNDLADIYVGLIDSSGICERLLVGESDSTLLQTALVEIDVQLAHVVHHWRRLCSRLQQAGLWTEDEFFDRFSK